MLRSPDAPRPRSRRISSRVVLFSSSRDWHARQLRAAFAKRGVEMLLLRLEACGFDTESPFGLRLGKLNDLPDGAMVRGISAGSFEAITRRLGILHALKALGVPVWNEATAIERCVDKSTTTFLLGRAGLPVPPSWTVEGLEPAKRVVEAEAGEGPLVLKPLFGSQGRGLVLVQSVGDLPPPEEVGDIYHLQRFVGGEGPDYHDFRVFVIAGEPVAAMLRHSREWITNVKRGGKPMPTPLDRELAELSAAAAAAVGAAFCGVDIIRGRDHRPYVLEVNSMPAWSGLQTVSSVKIADILAEGFSTVLRTSTKRRVA
jgi:tetrahydromethanopterin:alpha-L-glutamate ligase